MNGNETSQKTMVFIKSNLLNFVVIITSFSYILYNFLTLDTGVTLLKGTAYTLLALVCGFIIKQSLGENGFVKGNQSKIWNDNLSQYKEVCNTANAYIDKVDNFYACEEIEIKKDIRRSDMASGQMRYCWFFNENGEYVENPEQYKKLKRKQKRILKYCINLKVYNLDLFSEYSLDKKNYTHVEKTDGKQRSKMYTKNMIIQIIASVVGGYFTASLRGDIDLGAIIMSVLQVSIWIATGVIQLFLNYNYITIEKVNKLIRKKELIGKFTAGCVNGLYSVNPYDEMERKEREKQNGE